MAPSLRPIDPVAKEIHLDNYVCTHVCFCTCILPYLRKQRFTDKRAVNGIADWVKIRLSFRLSKFYFVLYNIQRSSATHHMTSAFLCYDSMIPYMRLSCFISCNSSAPYFPFDILDTDLFPGLLIVIKPLTILQIDAGEFAGRFEPFGYPITLWRHQRCPH